MLLVRKLGASLATCLLLCGVALLSGCPAAATCSPDNCAGCCKGTTCVINTTSSNCGTGGDTCSSCSDDETCSDEGECVAAVSCVGCIDLSGTCVTGNSLAACGGGGAECTACTGGKVCTQGLCVAESCTGCLNGSTCEIGNMKDKCGKGGGACQACTGTQNCQDRKCQGPATSATCNPTLTPTSCCDDLGMPQPGNTITACGTGGTACMTCAGAGATCVNGVCSKPCGTDCVGCCDASGNCKAAVTATCGVNGAACQNCGTGTCSNGACVSTSCATMCVGCCAGTGADACKAGSAQGQCGGGGKSCVACQAGQSCIGNTCIVDPSSLWDLIILSAQVVDKDPAATVCTNWDCNSGPDVYLALTVDAFGPAKKVYYSAYVNNTVYPDWATATWTYTDPVTFMSTTLNNKVLNGVSAAMVQKAYFWKLLDEDGNNRPGASSDDDMGECAYIVYPSMFDGQSRLIDCNVSINSVKAWWKLNWKLVPHT